LKKKRFRERPGIEVDGVVTKVDKASVLCPIQDKYVLMGCLLGKTQMCTMLKVNIEMDSSIFVPKILFYAAANILCATAIDYGKAIHFHYLNSMI